MVQGSDPQLDFTSGIGLAGNELITCARGSWLMKLLRLCAPSIMGGQWVLLSKHYGLHIL